MTDARTDWLNERCAFRRAHGDQGAIVWRKMFDASTDRDFVDRDLLRHISKFAKQEFIGDGWGLLPVTQKIFGMYTVVLGECIGPWLIGIE